MSKPASRVGVMLFALGGALVSFAVTWALLAPHGAEAKLPLGFQAKQVSTGTGTLLDPASLDSERVQIDEDVPLTRVQQVLSVEPGNSDVMTAQIGTTLSRDDREGDDALAGATVQRVSVDRDTALATDDAANSSLAANAGEPSVPVKATGLTFTWPRDAERRDYEFYDVDARQSAPMKYSDDGDVEGIPVYIYTQSLEDVDPAEGGPSAEVSVKPEALPESAPQSLRESSEPLRLRTFHSATRTAYVEPKSGRILKSEETVHEYLAEKAGEEAVTVADYSLDSTPESTQQAVSAAEDVADATRRDNTVIPWVLGIAGVAALLAALGVQFLRNRRI